MAESGKIGSSISEELHYAANDIRRVWEQAWFERPVTPSLMETAMTREGDDPLGRFLSKDEQPEGRAAVYGQDPDVPSALEGIGHSGGDDVGPDHTRDAVRDFYGVDTPREPLDDLLSPDGEDGPAQTHGPQR